MLPWQQRGRCHSVSFMMYIAGESHTLGGESHVKKVGEACRLAFKSRILVPPWILFMVSLRVLLEKRHYIWLSKYLLGWIRKVIVLKKRSYFFFFVFGSPRALSAGLSSPVY